MKYYKLLTQDLKSHNNTQWELNVPVTINIPGNTMCTDQVLHCYNHPLLAVIFNPIHAAISDPRLFEIEVDEIVASDGLKFASKSQTLIKELSIPEITLQQKIEFGIRVAKLVYKDSTWNLWADNWLNGSDKSKESAIAAYNSAAFAALSFVTTSDFFAANAAYRSAYSASTLVYTHVICDSIIDYAASAASDTNEFNQKMIDIIEEIVKVKE